MLNRREFIRDLTILGAANLLLPSCGTNTSTSPLEPTPEPIPQSPIPLVEPKAVEGGDRSFWLNVLTRLAQPILSRLSEQRLKAEMPVEAAPGFVEERRKYTHLEAFGRLMAGIAPWLELDLAPGEEETLQSQYEALARESLDAATDPTSLDFMNFNVGAQPLVDAAYLAYALLRAPRKLWDPLTPTIRQNIVSALQSTRVIQPFFNNWLLFSAMIEAALFAVGESWNPVPVENALGRLEEWYKGDGVYGDGPPFHWDYYNSYVIHPMLMEVLRVLGNQRPEWTDMEGRVLPRAKRYAEILERMISPEGAFPSIGRSTTYRFGTFHLLAYSALTHQLPEKITPPQTRSALTAVIHRVIEAPGTFDEQGWLTIGFYGHQPALAETYISTGSLYLCALGLLPLGLPPEDPFWFSPAEDWTSKKIWAGQNLEADHSISV
jgi:hypothetical protein